MKKIEEPEALKEIHEIRRKQYEETKDMSHEEHIAYTKRKSRELEKLLGFDLPRLSKISNK